ncbi:MAG: hypothetical protein R3C49_23230 [Planctomycetaceae bacterium]
MVDAFPLNVEFVAAKSYAARAVSSPWHWQTVFEVERIPNNRIANPAVT